MPTPPLFAALTALRALDPDVPDAHAQADALLCAALDAFGDITPLQQQAGGVADDLTVKPLSQWVRNGDDL